MLIILGADWCQGCKAIKKKLTQLNVEYEYIKMPPGKAGWDLVELMTGRRAVPAVFYRFKTLRNFNEIMDSFNLTPRELTEEELDDLDD